MANWIVCPACNLRHSRGPEACPRCRSRSPGATPVPETSASRSATAAARHGASRSSRSWSIVAVVGVALLGGIMSRAGRLVVASAVSHLHWRDPALLRIEANLEHDLVPLRTIVGELEPYRAAAPGCERDAAERASALERAQGALESACAADGLDLEERLPPRARATARGSWTTSSVRVRAGRTPSELLGLLGRLAVHEGIWLEGARCTEDGCSLLVSAAAFAKKPRTAATVVPLPSAEPRPWWPPSAAVCDRIQERREEYRRLRAVATELGRCRYECEAAAPLELVLAAAGESHRTAIGSVVEAAEAEGLTSVEVVREVSGLRITVPRPSAGFESRLERLGALSHERSSGPSATYRVYGPPQPQQRVTPADLPDGFSLRF